MTEYIVERRMMALIQYIKGFGANIYQLIEALVEFDYDEALKEMDQTESTVKEELPYLKD